MLCMATKSSPNVRTDMWHVNGAGLVPPAAALFLLGRGGAILMVIMLFMAVTSSGSAELVAVSSLFTYDVYRTYINPNATGALPRAPACASHAGLLRILSRSRSMLRMAELAISASVYHIRTLTGYTWHSYVRLSGCLSHVRACTS